MIPSFEKFFIYNSIFLYLRVLVAEILQKNRDFQNCRRCFPATRGYTAKIMQKRIELLMQIIQLVIFNDRKEQQLIVKKIT